MKLDYLNENQLEFYKKKCLSFEEKCLFWQRVILNTEHGFYYLTQILGYKDIGEFHLKELDKIGSLKKIEKENRRRLWIWARGHFKTSLISEAHAIYLIVNNPSIRILIVSNTLDIAKTILRNIRNHFISTESFRQVFPRYCPKPNKEGKIEFGTTESFNIRNRGRVLKEPTVMCAGVGTNLTGLHFDFMIIDDLVTKDSVSNDTQIQASKDYYASLRQLFDNPTLPKEDVIGTTYHFNDLYSNILKSDDFEKSIIPACDNDFNNIVFKERFTKEGLESILNDPMVGPYQWSSQYLLNPINPKDVKFKEEWLKYYQQGDYDLYEYICVDPASTQKKKSDFTVIERWGLDWQGNAYLLEGIRDKLTAYQRVDKLFQFVRNSKNLRSVRYEVLGGRHGDLEMIERKKIEDKIDFVISETKATSASKIDRIEQRLVGQYHAGKVWLPYSLNYKSLYDGKTHDFVQELRLEYLQFPFTEHDDILDCHSQLYEERLSGGEKPRVAKEKKPMTADDEEKYYQKIKKLEGLYSENAKDVLTEKRARRIIKGAMNVSTSGLAR